MIEHAKPDDELLRVAELCLHQASVGPWLRLRGHVHAGFW